MHGPPLKLPCTPLHCPHKILSSQVVQCNTVALYLLNLKHLESNVKCPNKFQPTFVEIIMEVWLKFPTGDHIWYKIVILILSACTRDSWPKVGLLGFDLHMLTQH